MNPYYAAGFLSALVFWVWPVFLYKTLDVHWITVAVFGALLFLGAGRAASEIHIRYIAPKEPPRGPMWAIATACGVIFVLGLLTRVGHHLYLNGD